MTLSTPPAHATPTLGVPAQRGRGVAILVVTGLITLQSIAAVVGVATGHAYTAIAGTPLALDPLQGLGLLGLFAWLLLAPWMATAARAVKANGYPMTYRPWVAWWGWVIPIWNLWAPYRFMRDATQGFAVRLLGLWWATWLLGTITIWSSGESRMVEGVLTETQTSLSAPLNAITLTVSWFLLARIVWTVSQGSDHGSLRREPPARPPTEF